MATKRIKDLTATATQMDLVSGNYLALDGTNGTKKLPAELIAKESSLEDTDSRTFTDKYIETDIALNSTVSGYGLQSNITYHLAIYEDYNDGAFSVKIFPVEKGKTYLAKNVYGNKNQPFGISIAESIIPNDGQVHTFVTAITNGLVSIGKADVIFTSTVDGYAHIETASVDEDATLSEIEYIAVNDYVDEKIPQLENDVATLQSNVADLQTAVEISEKKTVYNAVTMDSSVTGKAMMPNEQYHLTFYQAALSGTVSTKIYPIENGKTYIARNVYGYKANPSGVLIAKTLIPEDTSASSYTQRWFNGLVNLGKADVQFTSSINGYAYVTTLTADNDASLDEVVEVPYTVEEYVDKKSNYNNQWFGKKIVWIGTSVPFGSNATTSYVKVAQDILGFDVVNASIPGEALHCAVSGATPYPLTYGSTCLSKAEYIAAKAAGLSNIEIADSPIEPWTPGGNYNSYYRCWDNVITADNEDADLWVLDVVPNNSSYALTDWDLFNVDTWSYNDSSDFADHRTTFLGALLFLLDKIYTLNPKARIVLLLGSNFNYSYGLSNFEKLKEKNVAVIDVWAKINKLKPSLDVVKSMGGTDWHPSNFGHECLGKMLANELLLIA